MLQKHANIKVNTDLLSIGEVLEKVLEFLGRGCSQRVSVEVLFYRFPYPCTFNRSIITPPPPKAGIFVNGEAFYKSSAI